MSVLYSTFTVLLLAKTDYKHISDAESLFSIKLSFPLQLISALFTRLLCKKQHAHIWLSICCLQEAKADNCAAAAQSKLCHCVMRNGMTNHGAGKHEWLNLTNHTRVLSQSGRLWSGHSICLCENTKPSECVAEDVNMQLPVILGPLQTGLC